MSGPEIGVVYTPVKTAKQIIQISGFLDELPSKYILADYACGSGNLLHASIDLVEKQNKAYPEKLIANDLLKTNFESRISKVFSDLKKSTEGKLKSTPIVEVSQEDFFLSNYSKAHRIIINPPWVNFQNLPTDYKPLAKTIFNQYYKYNERSQLLLGNSRGDLAGPFLLKALEHLAIKGKLLAFLPSSLFFGFGANKSFLHALERKKEIELLGIWELDGPQWFEGIQTASAAVLFRRTREEPKIEYSNSSSFLKRTVPLYSGFGELKQTLTLAGGMLQSEKEYSQTLVLPCLPPRQGVNTCGANQLYFFSKRPDTLEHLYPLYDEAKDQRWILLPHDIKTGKALDWKFIGASTKKYLRMHETNLIQRKGQLIQGKIKNNLWWSLLGVGPYTFSPFKIIWKAMGSHVFQPKLVFPIDGLPVIPHQSLYAYLSFWDEEHAKSIFESLISSNIQEKLESQKGQGTMNWAQPGRIKSLIRFEPSQKHLP